MTLNQIKIKFDEFFGTGFWEKEYKPHITVFTEQCVRQAEQQGQTLPIHNVVESKPNERAALKHAVDAIYFADNSDYLSGLYGVVRSLTGLDEPTEEEIKKLFKELNPE